MLQIIEENKSSTMTLLELTDNEKVSFLGDNIKDIMPELTNINLNMNKILTQDIYESQNEVSTSDFIIIGNLLPEKHVSSMSYISST